MSEESNLEAGGESTLNILSSILSDPQKVAGISNIISKHPLNENRDSPPQQGDNNSITSNVTPSNDGQNDEFVETFTTQETQENRENSNFPQGIFSLFSSLGLPKNDNHTKLLLALRPYLSPRRQRLVDDFLSIDKIAKIFKSIT